jgi:hypothetical protein
MSRVTAGAPVLGRHADTTGAQRHLRSSQALDEMPTAMEYLISLLHDACSWEKYKISSKNNIINHLPTFAGHFTWNHRRAPGQMAGIHSSADQSASQPLAHVESTGFNLLFIRMTVYFLMALPIICLLSFCPKNLGKAKPGF